MLSGPAHRFAAKRDAMTTRRDALLALPLLCATSSIQAQAPHAGPPRRLGALFPGFDDQGPRPQRPFYIGLRQRGWVLGENLVPEPAYADGKVERLGELAEQLVRKRVDVILVYGDPAAVAAARATRTIPIVFFGVFFPVELGLIDSYARPGRNATGQAQLAGIEITVKRREFLKEVAPGARRLSWLLAGDSPSLETVAGGSFNATPMLAAAAQRLGFEPRFHPWRAAQDLEAVFGEVAAWHAQAVTAGAGWVYDMRQRVAVLSLRHRLPSAFLYREVVESGGLLSYGVGRSEAAYAQERLIEYVDRILRGTPPADLPVERPNRYELVLNMRTANSLGLNIPQSVLLRADEVIQ
jgi:putative tryptophan/tyrosine transport system substrate-binding protein